MIWAIYSSYLGTWTLRGQIFSSNSQEPANKRSPNSLRRNDIRIPKCDPKLPAPHVPEATLAKVL